MPAEDVEESKGIHHCQDLLNKKTGVPTSQVGGGFIKNSLRMWKEVRGSTVSQDLPQQEERGPTSQDGGGINKTYRGVEGKECQLHGLLQWATTC